jgi:hypothetical protein
MSSKKEKMRFFDVLKSNLVTYTQSTPLLALPYIGEPGRPYTER